MDGTEGKAKLVDGTEGKPKLLLCCGVALLMPPGLSGASCIGALNPYTDLGDALMSGAAVLGAAFPAA